MAGNKEERKTKVVGDKSTRTYYFRSCKRDRLTNIESLPSDLLLEVVARVPAQDIYHLTRLVCRKWYHMIHTHSFLRAHLQHTTYGLLFHDFLGKSLCFVALQRGRIEISKINYIPKTIAYGSCNGLFVEMLPKYNLCITNPVLKQSYILPPLHVPLFGQNASAYSIAYSEATQEYKVFQTYGPSSDGRWHCVILTVGVDNCWRDLDTRHLSVEEGRDMYYRSPVITEGFMHWPAVDGNQVLTLNVETEVFTKTQPPIPQRKYYLSGGRHLSLLVVHNIFWFEAWEMKPETGEWRKARSIVLEGEESNFEEEDDGYLIPVGWLKYQEVLCFGTLKGQTFIFYNLLTHEINLFKPPQANKPPWALPCVPCIVTLHKNTLSWLN